MKNGMEMSNPLIAGGLLIVAVLFVVCLIVQTKKENYDARVLWTFIFSLVAGGHYIYFANTAANSELKGFWIAYGILLAIIILGFYSWVFYDINIATAVRTKNEHPLDLMVGPVVFRRKGEQLEEDEKYGADQK